jgi:hypothetical protein
LVAPQAWIEQPGGAEYRQTLAIVSRLGPKTRAASRRLRPSLKTNFRTAA